MSKIKFQFERSGSRMAYAIGTVCLEFSSGVDSKRTTYIQRKRLYGAVIFFVGPAADCRISNIYWFTHSFERA